MPDIWGLPGLSGTDKNRVISVNRIVKRVCGLIELCISVGRMLFVENPLTSRMWLCPPLAKLLKSHLVQTRFDFCQFGVPWRKATQIAVFGCPGFLQNEARCRFDEQYRCSRTRKRHLVLTGVHPSGKHWTSIAEPYPKQLCSHWSLIIKEQCVSN